MGMYAHITQLHLIIPKGNFINVYMKYLTSLLFTAFSSLFLLNAQINVEKVITIGKNAYYFQDYLVAISYFNQAIDYRPWLGEPYFLRSLAKFMLEDYKGAENDADLAISKNAFISKAYLIKALALEYQNKNKEAKNTLKLGLKNFPNDLDILFNLTELHIKEEEISDAKKSLNKINQISPNNKFAFLLKGNLFLLKKDTISARNSIKRSLQIDSTQAQAYAQLSQIDIKQKNFTEALNSLNLALKYAPKEKSLYLNRAWVKYSLQDLIGAMQDYTEAINLAPFDPRGYYNRALLRAEIGDNNNAFDDFSVVLKKSPNNYSAIYNQALIAMNMRNYKVALKNFNIVLEKYPNFQRGLLARAFTKKKLGNIKGAEQDEWKAYQQQKGKCLTKTKTKSKNSSNDEIIEKYNQLIETNSSENFVQNNFLSANLRGKIQNQEATLFPFDCFSLNYFLATSDKTKIPRIYFSEVLSSFNNSNQGNRRFHLALSNQKIDSLNLQSLKEELSFIKNKEKKTNIDLFNLGVIYLLLQNLEDSESYLNKAINGNKNEALFYFIRSTIRYKKHILKQQNLISSNSANKSLELPSISLQIIIQDLEQSLYLSPNFSYAYYNRAFIFNKMGKKEAALADYNKAISLNPIPEFFFNRGLLYLSLGKKDAAYKDFSKAGEKGISQAYNIIKQICQ